MLLMSDVLKEGMGGRIIKNHSPPPPLSFANLSWGIALGRGG